MLWTGRLPTKGFAAFLSLLGPPGVLASRHPGGYDSSAVWPNIFFVIVTQPSMAFRTNLGGTLKSHNAIFRFPLVECQLGYSLLGIRLSCNK